MFIVNIKSETYLKEVKLYFASRDSNMYTWKISGQATVRCLSIPGTVGGLTHTHKHTCALAQHILMTIKKVIAP